MIGISQMQNFNIGDRVYYKSTTDIGIIIDQNRMEATYYVRFDFGKLWIKVKDLKLANAVFGPQFNAGDSVYYDNIVTSIGVVTSYDIETNTYKVNFANYVLDCTARSLSLATTTNTQPEAIQNINTIRSMSSVVCECGVDSAGAGGLHANYCRKVVQ